MSEGCRCRTMSSASVPFAASDGFEPLPTQVEVEQIPKVILIVDDEDGPRGDCPCSKTLSWPLRRGAALFRLRRNATVHPSASVSSSKLTPEQSAQHPAANAARLRSPMRTHLLFCLVLWLAGLLFGSSPAAHAATYDPDLKWRTLKTEHFDIHFHQGIEQVANEFSRMVEDVYAQTCATSSSGSFGGAWR